MEEKGEEILNRTVIRVENLGKDYQIRKRTERFWKDIFSRQYEVKKAVEDVNFEIAEGEIVGYIGPNGAGKSTTIKMLTGILQPDRGQVFVNGIQPGKCRVDNAKNIGVVFGQRTQLWWDIPVKDTLHLMKHMYHIPEQTYQENLKLYSDILGLGEFMHLPVRQLSLGQRMRADIACAILHNPQILYLDEPTIGLDIFVKENVRGFIHEINQKKRTTVILTTHDMSDIEKLCSRVMVIDQGRIIYDGSLLDLREQYGHMESIEAKGVWDDVFLEEIKRLPSVSVTQEENQIMIQYDSRKVDSDKILFLLMKNQRICDIKVHEQSLDGIIKQLYVCKEVRENGIYRVY